ncbi:MAG: hypothetical protein LUG46_06100 [Erysipelotrichaceae bacterium]|nr:hypothetical protein [Erysipelotrichaceae bacterium]
MKTINLKKILKLVLTGILAFSLIGCSSSSTDDSSNNGVEKTTIDYDEVYASLPETSEPEENEISDDAKQLFIDAYNKTVDSGYYKMTSDREFKEVYYDSSTGNSFGVMVSTRMMTGTEILITDGTQEYYLYAGLNRNDDGTWEYVSPIAETELNGTIEVTKGSYMEYMYDYATEGSDYLIMFASQSEGDYDIIYVKDSEDYAYYVYLYDGYIVEIDTVYYEDDNVLVDTSFKYCYIGEKSAEDFDFEASKEQYSAYIGLNYEEAKAKVAQEQ